MDWYSFLIIGLVWNDVQVEILKRKMEGLSKDVLLERMIEEYGSMFAASKRIEWHASSVLPLPDHNQVIL